MNCIYEPYVESFWEPLHGSHLQRFQKLRQLRVPVPLCPSQRILPVELGPLLVLSGDLARGVDHGAVAMENH